MRLSELLVQYRLPTRICISIPQSIRDLNPEVRLHENQPVATPLRFRAFSFPVSSLKSSYWPRLPATANGGSSGALHRYRNRWNLFRSPYRSAACLFKLELYAGSEILGILLLEESQQLATLVTPEPNESHSDEDRDFVYRAASMMEVPFISWFTGGEGVVASIASTENGSSAMVFRSREGRYCLQFEYPQR